MSNEFYLRLERTLSFQSWLNLMNLTGFSRFDVEYCIRMNLILYSSLGQNLPSDHAGNLQHLELRSSALQHYFQLPSIYPFGRHRHRHNQVLHDEISYQASDIRPCHGSNTSLRNSECIQHELDRTRRSRCSASWSKEANKLICQ